MEKRMHEMTVRLLDNGDVLIEQGDPQENPGVVLSVDQVPVLTKWLDEAAAKSKQTSHHG